MAKSSGTHDSVSGKRNRLHKVIVRTKLSVQNANAIAWEPNAAWIGGKTVCFVPLHDSVAPFLIVIFR